MEPKKYEYIDALRGYAVLIVIVGHVAQLMVFDGIGSLLLSKASMGVQLFYVVSALTLTMSYKSRSDGFINFYVRRFFRIAPLFWTAIILYLYLYGLPPRESGQLIINWFDVALTATFMHMLMPSSINSIVPGGWSVAVEMSFYLIFPVLMLFIRGWKSGVLFVFVSYYVGKYASGVLGMMYTGSRYSFEDLEAWKYYILSSQISAFAVGILLYYLMSCMKFHTNRWGAYGVFFLAIISSILVFNFLQYGGPIAVLLYSLVFALFAMGLSSQWLSVLKNKFIRKLGVLSYSAYLLHFSIIYIVRDYKIADLFLDFNKGVSLLLLSILVLSLTVILSYFSHKFIEIQGVWVGNIFINYLNARSLKNNTKKL